MTSKLTFGRIAIATGLLTVLLAPTLNAETKLVRVNIPFTFMAGEHVLPAGQYRVEVDPASNRMRLRRADGEAGAYLSVYIAYKPQAPNMGTLVFHKYGNSHFLQGVWGAGRSWGYEVPASEAEREMVKVKVTREVAWIQCGIPVS